MNRLLSYQELKKDYPLSPKQEAFIAESRQTIQEILEGNDPRLLCIVGPCSIHDLESAKEYAYRLKEFAQEAASHFFLVMRVYCEKPRTLTGWKGFLYDPLLDGSHQIQLGLQWTRQLLIDLADLEVPAATEFLDPLTAFYYEDLITWGSIGARTSSSQPHRQLASTLAMPMGIKNGLAGNISAVVNGVRVASLPHTYLGLNAHSQPSIIQSPGNPYAHVVLRGGDNGPNYDAVSIKETVSQLEAASLDPYVLIDCSHQNSGKRPDQQFFVFQSILNQIKEGNSAIRGVLIESHLFAGNQPMPSPSCALQYGISLTDACLDWTTTTQLIRSGIENLTSIPNFYSVPAFN